MSTPLNELIARLDHPDADTRALALAELVRMGSQATAALAGALSSPSPRARELAAEGLGRIGEPAGAPALHAALNDTGECVRAQAAAGLMRMGDPRALEALIQTLTDCEDVLHAEHTLSAYALEGYGPAALPALAPELKSGDAWRRRRAFTVVRTLATRMLGQQGDWNTLHASLGTYDPDGPADQRDEAAQRWAAWIKTHVK
jgi:HEAT repeat protein